MVSFPEVSSCSPASELVSERCRAVVRAAAAAPQNRFGLMFYDEHVRVVERFARELANELSADVSIVVPAALLHDLAAIVDYGGVPTHPLAGAELAGSLLRDWGVDEGRIAAIQSCIRRHSMPVATSDGTPEEVCVSNADTLAQMARPGYWLYYAFRVREHGFSEGMAFYEKLVNDRWKLLVPKARELGSPMVSRLRETLFG